MKVRRMMSGLGLAPEPERPGVHDRTRVVTVGDVTGQTAGVGEPVHLGYHEVTTQALHELRPDMILSALVSPGFDCLDLAEKLAEAGFTGRYRAVTRTVPDPGLVRREIAERFPGLDFDIVLLDDGHRIPEPEDAVAGRGDQ